MVRGMGGSRGAAASPAAASRASLGYASLGRHAAGRASAAPEPPIGASMVQTTPSGA